MYCSLKSVKGMMQGFSMESLIHSVGERGWGEEGGRGWTP